MTIHELDVVELTEDLLEYGLRRGDRGTVVHEYAGDAFEVEFLDNEGRTRDVLTLRAGQLALVWACQPGAVEQPAP